MKKLTDYEKRMLKYMALFYVISLSLIIGLSSIKLYVFLLPTLFLALYFLAGSYLGHKLDTIAYLRPSKNLAKLLLEISIAFAVIIPLFTISLNPEYLRFGVNINNSIEKAFDYAKSQMNETSYNLSDFDTMKTQFKSYFNAPKYLQSILEMGWAFVIFILVLPALAFYIWISDINLEKPARTFKMESLSEWLSFITGGLFVISIFMFFIGLYLFLSGLIVFSQFFQLIGFLTFP